MKKTYKAVGYWYNKSKLDFPDPGWFVIENYKETEKQKVISYLNQAEILTQSRGFSYCRFNCGKDMLGSADLTDGEFIFPSSLVHYVEDHNIMLPLEFLNKVNGNKVTFKEYEKIESNIIDAFDFYIDFNWWLSQKGYDYLKSSNKTAGEENQNVYTYKDGTKKIVTKSQIRLIAPDGSVTIISK